MPSAIIKPLMHLPNRPGKPYIRLVPKSRPKERPMTIGIAAICDRGKSIVAISDHKVTATTWSAESQAHKMTILAKHWWVVWSAEDMLKIPPLLAYLKRRLFPSEHSAEEVSDALSGAYQQQIKTEAENLYLKRFGLTMETFLEKGKELLTPESFNSFREKIDQITIGCELMAFGFDEEQMPHIIVIRDPGTLEFCDPRAFSFRAIGTGAYSAESILYFHEVNWTMPLEKGIYHVCEAKFMAESAIGVGGTSTGAILQANGGFTLLEDYNINKVRDLWEAKGKPCLPTDTQTVVSEVLRIAINDTKKYLEYAKEEMPNPSSP
jgi:hypothetical protein